MNIRKEIDYSTMFAALDLAVSMNLPQMELYCEIGKAICARTEKGAAVAAANYLNEQYPDMAGFSPRNVRRMRDFYWLHSGTSGAKEGGTGASVDGLTASDAPAPVGSGEGTGGGGVVPWLPSFWGSICPRSASVRSKDNCSLAAMPDCSNSFRLAVSSLLSFGCSGFLRREREGATSASWREIFCSLLNMADIWDFINTVDVEDIKETLDRQIDYNWAIAQAGIQGDYGANIGKVLLSMDQSVATRAKAMAAAGSDARMSGCELPVVINSGSGNQGITVSVPVIVYAKERNVSRETLYRALALSNLTAIYQKTPIGRLSAYCGAVSAGIAYLCGGGFQEVAHTVVNALAIVSGIVCDGAKPSCAGKIAAAVDAGILGYQMYLKGQQFYSGDGIVTKGVDAMIQNVGRLGKEGMKETNEEIIKMMIGC